MQVVNTTNPMNTMNSVDSADLAFPPTDLYRYSGISASRGLTWFDRDAGQGYIYPDWFENQSGVIRLSFPRRRWFDRPFDRLTVLSEVEGLTTLSKVEGESRICLSALPNACLRGHDRKNTPAAQLVNPCQLVDGFYSNHGA